MKLMLFLGLGMTLITASALACLETKKPVLIDLPDPIFIFDEPKTKRATVVAELHVDAKGSTSLIKIISIKPSNLPEKPLADAIKMARFTPSQTKTSYSKVWRDNEYKGILTIEMNWE